MPKNRIGFSTDFNLTNSKVGIGTTNPRATLDVVGVLKGDFNISGVTTLTSYGGFFPQKQSGDGVTITGEVNTISEDIVVGLGKTFIVSSGSTISIGTLESISIGAHLSVPNGGITLRPQDPIEGTVRFNDDLNTLEFYNGVEWRQFTVTGASGRGVFGGGGAPSGYNTYSATIDYVEISTLGNALDFGTLSVARNFIASCSSETRGTYGGGGGYTNIIDYITIASAGNAIGFGDLTISVFGSKGCSSSTRGLFGGGYVPSSNTNVISYIQFSTLGDAIVFGDLVIPRRYPSALSSPTRGIYAGGISPTNNLLIDYVTIASTGHAVTFGNLTTFSTEGASSSSSIRGIIYGTSYNKIINYITITTLGNANYFGDLSFVMGGSFGSCSNQNRSIIGGGMLAPSTSQVNSIEYVTISTAGNSQDFGDLTRSTSLISACSDSHGGLGGF